jgi:cell wall-associated NlpC family hydrolase
MSISRESVVQAARSFIGTPFHHMARSPGVALDCFGVLICAGRAVGSFAQTFDGPSYCRMPPNDRALLNWCDEHLIKTSFNEMQAGDVVVMVVEKYPQHTGILGNYRHGGHSIIHACLPMRPPRVVETRLMWGRFQRFVAAYSFPGVG